MYKIRKAYNENIVVPDVKVEMQKRFETTLI